MSDFRSFATLLRTPTAAPPPPPVTVAAATPAPVAPAAVTAPPARPPQADPQVTHVIKGFAVELRRLRARAAEIFEMECDTLLAALAGEVLARELALAPADIAALVARARERIGPQSLRIRLSPDDAALIGEADAEGDATLGRGDAVFETEGGTIDMRLGSRVRAVLGERSVAI